MREYLLVVEGPQRGRRFPCDVALRIGRDERCEIRLYREASVSRLHARVTREGSSIWFCDLSELGSTINGRRILGETVALDDGDDVRLGRTLLRFRREAPPGERGQ